MVRPLSEWRKKIDEILSDGEWHVKDQVVREAMLLVPPGPAYRHAEKGRQRFNPGPRVRGDRSDSIATGQRLIAMQSIYHLFKSGAVEQREVAGVEQLRLMGGKPRTSVESTLITELNKQLEYWKNTYKVLPHGEVRDAILGGDPVASIERVLREVSGDEVLGG